jgi:nucleoside-diphosphate-sugar epimerase
MPVDLVTGGGGYLGSHLARALLARGRSVRIFDLHRLPVCPEEAVLFQGDMEDRASAREAVRGAERVFHIAFVQSLSRRPPDEAHRVNLAGMRNFLDAAVAEGVARFVFASTIEIYGTQPPYPCTEEAPKDSPVGWYGRDKWECEQLLWQTARDSGLQAAALRMPTICGLGFYNHRPLLSTMDRILDGKPMAVVGDGSTPGDFVLLDDVVDGFLLAGERKEAAGEAFNISARASSTQLEILRAMIDAAGSRSRVLRLPRVLARAGLTLGRLLGLHELPADQDGYLFHPNFYAIDKARRLLGYAPRASAAEAAAALIRAYSQDREAIRRRSQSY